MPTYRHILEELTWEELIAAAERFEVPVADRRTKALLVEALASSRDAAMAEILAELKRDRLKELCRALGLDDGGREKAVIVSRLVDDSRQPTLAAGNVGIRPAPVATGNVGTRPPPVTTGHRPHRAPPGDPRGRPAARPHRKPIEIQDGFLFESLKEDRPLAFALVTGQFIEGRIQRFDRFSVLVKTGGKVLLIYKSAISDISWPGPRSRP